MSFTGGGGDSPIITNEDEYFLYGNRRNLAYWFFFVFVMLTVMLTSFLSVNTLNTNFKYTFTEPVTGPLGLTSQRLEEPLWWLTLILIVSRNTFVIISIVRLSQPRDSLWRGLHIFISVINLCSEIVTTVLHFNEIRGCNNSPTGDPSGRNNLCNDYRWCCVYGTVDPAPNATVIAAIEPTCPLLLANCVPNVVADDLKWNWEFLIAFIFGLIMIAVSVLHIWLGVVTRDGRSRRYFDIRNDRIGLIPKGARRKERFTVFG